MSKYTTELRYICETEAGLSESAGYSQINNIIATARPKIFSFDYPIFDTDYKEPLETKILKHFYTREIGLETYGLWKLKLETKLNEIMPYYNKLYESELKAKDIDFFNTVNITTDHTLNKDGTSYNTNESTSNAETTVVDMYSETPQGALSEADLFTSETGATYLTTANKTHGNDTNTSNASGVQGFTNLDTYLEHTVGKMGGDSYTKILMDLRKSFLNIDMDIINDLNSLFFGLW